MIKSSISINNKLGLHARASAKPSKLAGSSRSDIHISRNGRRVNAKSAMGVMIGLPCRFVSTTLLSQADSCVGSKSSINLGDAKNILGTFNPPQEIFVDPGFLDTLDSREIRSGVAEIIKVHAIDGAASFDRLAADFDRLFADRDLLGKYIRSALLIKQRFIEEDEFDQGIRNIFN